MRRLPVAGTAFGFAEAVGDLWDFYQPGGQWVIPPGTGWVMFRNCGYSKRGQAWVSTTKHTSGNCLGGQSISWLEIDGSAGGSPQFAGAYGGAPYYSPFWWFITGSTRTVVYGEGSFASGGSKRFRNNIWFHRNAIGPTTMAPYPRPVQPAGAVAPGPHWLRSLDPFSLPIGQPAGTPRPIPYRILPDLAPNPYRSPHEQDFRGPPPLWRPEPDWTTPDDPPQIVPYPGPPRTPANDNDPPKKFRPPRPRGPIWRWGDPPDEGGGDDPPPRPDREPVVWWHPFFDPDWGEYERPEWYEDYPWEPFLEPSPFPPTQVIEFPLDGTKPKVDWKPGTPPKPPGKGEKEKKTFLTVNGVPAKVIGFVTESLDFINALYDALPAEFRPGYYRLHYRDKNTGEIKYYYKRRWRASQWQRMKALYEHWDHIDVKQAFKNLINEGIEDRFWGTFSRYMAQGALRSGIPRGLEIGPWDDGMILPEGQSTGPNPLIPQI